MVWLAFRVARRRRPSISLDRSPEPQPEVAFPASGTALAREQPLALVVDDEPLVRQMISSVLSRHGWRILEAGHGAEALAIGADAAVDLLITDYEMPGMNGIDVAEAYRHRQPDLPVLVVSAQERVGPLVSSRGCQFLVKPFDMDDLLALVTRLHPEESAGPDAERSRPTLVPEVRRPERRRYGSAGASRRKRPFYGWPRPTLADDLRRPVGDGICALRCFPSDDPQFAATVEQILSECTRSATWSSILDQVKLRLVERYPLAVIHPRNKLAANGDPEELWYCYRDGRLAVPSDDG